METTGPNVNVTDLNEDLVAKLQELIDAAAEDGIILTVASGFRDTALQEALFLERYEEDPSGSVDWDGRKWTIKEEYRGQPAAPPGESLHNHGYAVDFNNASPGTPTAQWLIDNVEKFGLRTYAQGGEPGHVAPADITHVSQIPEAPDAPAGTFQWDDVLQHQTAPPIEGSQSPTPTTEGTGSYDASMVGESDPDGIPYNWIGQGISEALGAADPTAVTPASSTTTSTSPEASSLTTTSVTLGSLADGPVSNDIQPGFIVQIVGQEAQRIEGGQFFVPPAVFYYVQPTHSSTGGGPSVFWRIEGMDADQIAEIVEGNDNYGDTQAWDQAQWDAMVAEPFTDGVGTEWPLWRPSAATVNAQGLGLDGFRFDASGPDEAPQLVTVEEFVQDLVVELGLMGTAAWNDEGVQAVIARVISEPVLLGQDLLFDLFNDTEFSQKRSGSKEKWDKARGQLVDGKWTGTRGDLVNTIYEGSEGGLVHLWKTYHSMSDKLDTPDIREDELSLDVQDRLYANAVSIAQGTMTWWQAVGSIQDYAAKADGDNAWKEHNRKIQQQVGQYDVDLDNKAWEIEQFEQQWGMHSPGAEGGIRLGVVDQAKKVLSNSMSMADVKQSIMDAANELYPHKPSLVPTYLWAEPWVNAYNNLMPTSAGPVGSAGSMYNTLVNQALRDNTGIEDFERALRGTDDWKNSNKGVSGYRQMFDVLSDAFGFSGQRGYGR
ncbi:MAG: hypothetical protein CMA54_03160 [Euryarchaeota archaeon]|jgi:hypothetical protein|nr:hypothetical protein [Euryarchaeota archaeon]|tara:strand:- start:5123 stop:7267 length:2145 start_codon:yes stop_codon:yes gene_type:complete